MVDIFSFDRLSRDNNKITLLLEKSLELLRKDNKPVVFFGAGIIGKIYLDYFTHFKIGEQLLFCDNSSEKWGTKIKGIPIISFEQLVSDYSNSYVIITSLKYQQEIFNQLKKHCLDGNLVVHPWENIILSEVNFYEKFNVYSSLVQGNQKKFEIVYKMLSDEMSKRVFYDRINYSITADNKYLIPLVSKEPKYFDPEIVPLSEEEILIDGGAYSGDTAEEFVKITKGKFKKVYSFEPEESKHQEFKMKFVEFENIQILRYGLWSQQGKLRFKAENSGTSQVSNDGNIEIAVISIDEFLCGEPVSLIKMDIEGAELEALKGAQNSIKKYRPKLAICVYHNPMDLVEIPLYLKSLVPDYKIYLRHYNTSASETVCYAV